MEYLGIEYRLSCVPELDPGFLPFGLWMDAFLEKASVPFDIALEREEGQIAVFHTRLRGPEYAAANLRFTERVVKFLLWSAGGFRIYLCGAPRIAGELRGEYSKTGARRFDAAYMEMVYGHPFEVIGCTPESFPRPSERAASAGGHRNGCRIGLDVGCTSLKVSAVIDGRTVFTDASPWAPREASDPQYLIGGVGASLRCAAEKLPRVDAVGVSTAGIVIGGKLAASSLFLGLPEGNRVQDLYQRAASFLGGVPLAVANDGDVAALSGAMELGSGCVLGISMGTAEAAGYVDGDRRIQGRISELAFAPVDLGRDAARDAWSTDFGVGCGYLSQDAVARLASAAGIAPCGARPAEISRAVLRLAEDGQPAALAVYRTVGAYLAHALALYGHFYEIRRALIMGGVTAGAGGKAILEACRGVLRSVYPSAAENMEVLMPPAEADRRFGQAIAAASLPEVQK